MVTGDKNQEEEQAKKNPKSQNAFEEVCVHYFASFSLFRLIFRE
jgi:hypothetical protein